MDLNKLNEIIKDSGITKVALAKKLNLSHQGLYSKLNGDSDFTRGEVEKLCHVLHIDDLELKESVFFNSKVD